MGKVIVITSGKGGTGKTTTAINLGAAIRNFGKSVLIVDGNLSTPNIGIQLNSPEVPVNLNQVLSKRAKTHEAVYEHPSGLKIMPSSLSVKELKMLAPEKLKDIKKDLEKLADYVIIDSAAGLGKEAESALKIADEIIVVANPEVPSVTSALKTVKLAEKLKKPVRGVLMTRIRKDQIEMRPEEVKDMLETEVLGMVPEEDTIRKALNYKDSVINTQPKSKTSRAYKEIASDMLGVEYDSSKDRPSIIERLLKRTS
ncbi:MAG: cell division ATPase MinD [Candidatus Pacearchaeota archaeon]